MNPQIAFWKVASHSVPSRFVIIDYLLRTTKEVCSKSAPLKVYSLQRSWFLLIPRSEREDFCFLQRKKRPLPFIDLSSLLYTYICIPSSLWNEEIMYETISFRACSSIQETVWKAPSYSSVKPKKKHEQRSGVRGNARWTHRCPRKRTRSW